MRAVAMTASGVGGVWRCGRGERGKRLQGSYRLDAGIMAIGKVKLELRAAAPTCQAYDPCCLSIRPITALAQVPGQDLPTPA